MSPSRLLSVLFILSACGGVSGSGRRVTEDRTVPAFRTLEVHSAIRVTATTGARSLTVTADDDLISQVEASVVSDRLVLRLPAGLQLFPTREPIDVTVSNDVFEGASANGASIVRFPATRIGELRLSAGGASVLEVSDVDSDTVDVRLDGASTLTASGRATAMRVAAGGSSTARVSSLPVETLTVTFDGASTGRARATTAVSGSLGGASRLELEGTPGRVDVTLSGASTLERLGR
jgi:hypothetical protein